MKTAEELKAELSEAKARVAELENQIRNGDDYPVGTVLKAGNTRYALIAVKMERIVGNLGSRYPSTDKPVWVTIFDDFSGSSYDSLADIKREYRSYTWEKVA